MSVEHMCGKVWRKGPIKDCKRKGVHGNRNKPQGGWRMSNEEYERIGK